MFILSLGLTMWGLWVGNPFVDTFDVSFYAGLKAIAHESVWGLAFLISGLTMMYGVVRSKLDVMGLAAFFGFCLWSTVAGLYAFTDPSVTPTATNSILALAHAWAWLCIKTHPRLFTERMAVLDVTAEEFADWKATRSQNPRLSD